MLLKVKRGWELPESAATPEAAYLDRRALLKGLGGAALAGGGVSALAAFPAVASVAAGTATGDDPSTSLYPVANNPAFTLDRDPTPENIVTTYNNFYEFGSHKTIWQAAQDLKIRPWTLRIDGLVETPRDVDIDTLLRAMPLEERLYRFRCVEAWAMAVPWSGFPLRALVEFAKPLASAKYLALTTFDRDVHRAPGFRQDWYPWPYREGLTVAEATNEVAFIATGLYGKPLPRQNGAPLRLVTPWKYGFKSIKSLVRIQFVDRRPRTFWEEVNSREYGFWANVNPAVPHARWSQATEELLGSGERVPTQPFNGYGEFVADLYKGLEGERLFT